MGVGSDGHLQWGRVNFMFITTTYFKQILFRCDVSNLLILRPNRTPNTNAEPPLLYNIVVDPEISKQ